MGLSIGGALIGGAASIAGKVVGYRLDKRAAERARGWQERMSNSAHQREAADLEKAGLNRILGYTGGGGASTPAGAKQDVPDLGSIVSTALQAARLKKEIEVMDEDILKKRSETLLNEASAKGVEATMGKTTEITELTKVEIRLQKLLYKQAAATGNSIAGRTLWSTYRVGKITWEQVEKIMKGWFNKKKGHKPHGASKSINQKTVRPKVSPSL